MTTKGLGAELAGATRALTVYALSVTGAGVLAQVIIAIAGNTVGILASVLIAAIAAGYVTLLLVYGKNLRRLRYGALTAHFVTYLAVNVGFALHFLILALMGAPVVQSGLQTTPAALALSPGWFGVLISMPALWGAGLLVHTLGAVLGRGFEASR